MQHYTMHAISSPSSVESHRRHLVDMSLLTTLNLLLLAQRLR
jgi:hypothetical protein